MSIFRLNDFSESSQSSRGYTSTNGAARVGARQGNSRSLSDSDNQEKRTRIGRPSMQPASSQPTKGSTNSGQDGPQPPCQPSNRKARTSKPPDLPSPSLAGPLSLPPRGLGPEDAEYANLIGAMDNDLDRPEPVGAEALQEPSSQSTQNKGTHIWSHQESLEQQRRDVVTL